MAHAARPEMATLEAELQKLAKLPENRRCANCDVENRCVSARRLWRPPLLGAGG